MTFFKELEDLARVHHWWWKMIKNSGSFPGATYWWRDPNVPQLRDAQDRALVRPIIERVMSECAQLDQERDYLEPYARLYDRYFLRARRWELPAENAHDLATDLLMGYPGKDGEVGGYLQHPEWLPLGRKDFLRRVQGYRPGQVPTIQVKGQKVQIQHLSLSDDYDDDVEVSDRPHDFNAVVPSLFQQPALEFALASEREEQQERLQQLIDDHRERFAQNTEVWNGLYQRALEQMSSTYAEMIKTEGPWDQVYSTDEFLIGWYPTIPGVLESAIQLRQERLHSTDAEQRKIDQNRRQLKSRARMQLLEKMAALTPYLTLYGLATATLRDHRNRDWLHVMRTRMGPESWDAMASQLPFPAAFTRSIIVQACEQRLYAGEDMSPRRSAVTIDREEKNT